MAEWMLRGSLAAIAIASLGPAAFAADAPQRNWGGVWWGFGAGYTQGSYSQNLSSEVCMTSSSASGAGSASASCVFTGNQLQIETRASVPGREASNSIAAAIDGDRLGFALASALGSTATTSANVSDITSPSAFASATGADLTGSSESYQASPASEGVAISFVTETPPQFSQTGLGVHVSSITGEMYGFARSRLETDSGIAEAAAFGINGLASGFSDAQSTLAPSLHVRYDQQVSDTLLWGAEIDVSLLPGKQVDWTEQRQEFVEAFNRDVEVDVSAMATARLRAGVVSGDYLVYATGGLAYANVNGRQSVRVDDNLPEFQDYIQELEESSEGTSNAFGAVIGGGASAYLSDETVMSLEALYYHFDEAVSFGEGPSTDWNAYSVSMKLSFRLD